MTARKKGAVGAVFQMTLPVPVMERIDRRADACYSKRQEFIRRFIIENIDIIDPPHAEN